MKISSLLNLTVLSVIVSGCCFPPFFICNIPPKTSERRELVLTDSTSQHQEPNESPWVPDIYGGMTLSTLRGDKETDAQYKWLTGPVVGLEWQLYQYKNFTFTPSLQYSSTGGKEVTEHNDPYYSYSYATQTKLHALDLQPYISYAISDAFSLQGGPRFSYLISAKRTHESQGTTAPTVRSKEGLKDTALGAGIGLTYKIPKSFLRVSANYNHGFTNRMDDPMYNRKKLSRSAQVTLVYDIGNGIENQKRSKQ